MSGYVKGLIDQKLELTTLAGETLVSMTLDEVMTESGRVASVDCVYTLTDMTTALDDGPILFGVAHSDYSDAEIEEVVEVANSWDRGDKIAQERAKRLVRQIGVLTSGVEAGIFGQGPQFNDGNPVKTKLNWGLTTGDTLKFWCYNMGTSAIASTIPNFNVNGHANLFIKY